VLLIDADLRRPRVHSIFGFTAGERGFSTAIAGADAGGLDGIRTTDAPTLDVLPAGPLPPNPGELLGTEAAKAVIAKALAAYDWVIVDAPPLTAVADAAVLLGHIAHSVFVVRPFITSKHSIARAREILAQTPGRVAGIVVNTADVPLGNEPGYYRYGYGYYRYGYGYGYGYGDSPKEGAGRALAGTAAEGGPGRRG
jgi:capsular exopolysaccharide synthesis family protein